VASSGLEVFHVNGRRLSRQGVLVLMASVVLQLMAFGPQRAEAAPEDERVPGSEVAVGLRKIEGIAADVAAAAGTDKAKALELIDEIEPAWQKIEGTIRANDKDAYVSFEDSFGVLERAAQSGDGKKAFDAAAAIATTAKDYVTKYPPGSEAAPSAPTPPEPGTAESTMPAPASTPASATVTPPEREAAEPAMSAPGPSPSQARASEAASAREAASAPRTGLPRTGPHRPSGPLALAGAALGAGGLAVIGGARRRNSPPAM
jgi:hypothetical protein